MRICDLSSDVCSSDLGEGSWRRSGSRVGTVGGMHTSTVRETTVRRPRMLPAIDTRCPCCGEPIELFVDGSAGDQQYIEDCQVCCRPIVVTVALDADGEPLVAVRGACSDEDTPELQYPI